jgi:hypothetical protein
MPHSHTKLFCSFKDRLADMDEAARQRRLGAELSADFADGKYQAKEWRNAPFTGDFTVKDLKQNDIAGFRKARSIKD